MQTHHNPVEMLGRCRRQPWPRRRGSRTFLCTEGVERLDTTGRREPSDGQVWRYFSMSRIGRVGSHLLVRPGRPVSESLKAAGDSEAHWWRGRYQNDTPTVTQSVRVATGALSLQPTPTLCRSRRKERGGDMVISLRLPRASCFFKVGQMHVGPCNSPLLDTNRRENAARAPRDHGTS